MKYTKKSLKYVFGNFGYLILFGLFPAVFLASSLDVATLSKVFRSYFTGNPHAEFYEIFHAVSIFNFHSPLAVLAQIVGVLLVVFCVSLMMAFIEKHMRIGKRTWNGMFAKLNDNLISTGGMTLLFAAVYEVWALVVSALLFLCNAIDSRTAVYVSTIIVFYGMHVVLLYVVSVFYLWLPCFQITGFRPFEALRYSYQLMGKAKWRVIGEQFFSLVIAEALLAAVSIFVRGYFAVFALATIVFAGMILIFVARMQVVYFECAQIDRADLEKKFY